MVSANHDHAAGAANPFRSERERELLEAKEALERKTQELAHSLALMRATFESTTDAIVVSSSERKITGFNQQYLDMWNIPREETLSKDHVLVIRRLSVQVEDPQTFLRRIEEIYRTSPAESYDLIKILDGRVIERFSRIQFVNGKNVGRVWSFRDLTQRLRAEEALRDEKRILELLHKTGETISSTLDLQTLLQEVTNAATQISGGSFGAFFYNTTDANGEVLQLYTLCGAPREAFEKFGHPRATALFAPTFRGEGVIRSADILKDERYGKSAPHYGMPKGHLPVRSYLAVPVISRTGSVIGGLFFGHPRVGVFTERTERIILGIAAQAAIAIDNARLVEDLKLAALERERLLDAERAARSEAERVSQLKDEFLATLSHELRTPLNSILGWSQILALGRYKPEEFKQALETISRNAKTQKQLIEDLLDMSRIINGKLHLDRQSTNAWNLVTAAADAILPTAEAKGVRLTQDLDPEAGTLLGDPHRLQQIVWNLLSNAVKFTPANGDITLVLRRVEANIEITVKDSGTGIAAEFLPEIFERFRQADSSSTRKFGGLGLGLSIVRHLVQLHDGTIRVESAGVGKGTTFVVAIPRLVGTANDRAPVAPRIGVEEIPLANVKILVVEDEQDSRELVRRLLTECKADVCTASSADEGLRLLKSKRPDVLISDIGMPNKDGYQFIREVRGLAPEEGGSTPAIALTAFARSEDRAHAMRNGFQMHITKPIEPQYFLATVASLIASKSSSVGPLPHP